MGHRRSWCPLVGVCALGIYQYILSDWTCDYHHTLVIKGRTYTDLALKLLANYPGSTCENLIEDAIGVSEAIWPRSEIIFRRTISTSAYTLSVLLFSLSLIATVQSLRIGRTSKVSK